MKLIRYNFTGLVRQAEGWGKCYFRNTETSPKSEIIPWREILNNEEKRDIFGKDNLFCLQCPMLKK